MNMNTFVIIDYLWFYRYRPYAPYSLDELFLGLATGYAQHQPQQQYQQQQQPQQYPGASSSSSYGPQAPQAPPAPHSLEQMMQQRQETQPMAYGGQTASGQQAYGQGGTYAASPASSGGYGGSSAGFQRDSYSPSYQQQQQQPQQYSQSPYSSAASYVKFRNKNYILLVGVRAGNLIQNQSVNFGYIRFCT